MLQDLSSNLPPFLLGLCLAMFLSLHQRRHMFFAASDVVPSSPPLCFLPRWSTQPDSQLESKTSDINAVSLLQAHVAAKTANNTQGPSHEPPRTVALCVHRSPTFSWTLVVQVPPVPFFLICCILPFPLIPPPTSRSDPPRTSDPQ